MVHKRQTLGCCALFRRASVVTAHCFGVPTDRNKQNRKKEQMKTSGFIFPFHFRFPLVMPHLVLSRFVSLGTFLCFVRLFSATFSYIFLSGTRIETDVPRTGRMFDVQNEGCWDNPPEQSVNWSMSDVGGGGHNRE